MKYSSRLTIKMLFVLIVIGNSVFAQTLQSVTDNGNTTSNGISVSSLTSNSPSLAGTATPTNIGSLNGIRINGTIPSSSQNGITYQSGGGGGAAIGFSRGGSYDTFIDFYTSGVVNSFGSISHRMRIASNGNVGIGTVSPAEKLSVNGKIRAQEIKVEAVNWPDYVFADNYKLPSLQETEKHIKEKGHLPGIPSAEEVKTDGVDLGDMNAKLLKKIEELTLYLIELKKLNETQNEKHEKEIQAIKKSINLNK
jgi:hypothetical protein